MDTRGYICMTCKLLYKFPHFSTSNCEKCNGQTQRCEHKYCRTCSKELGLCLQCGNEPTIKESDLKTIDEQIEQLKAPKKEPVINDPMLAKYFKKEKNPFEEEFLEQRRQSEIESLEFKRSLINIKDKNELMSHLRY